MEPEQIGFVLSQAIRDGYAVTLTRGGHVFVAEPYALRKQGDAWVIVYWHAERGRVEMHRVDLFAEAVDLGRPLDTIPTYGDSAPVEANYLYSTNEVADMLGITPARVRALAEARSVGRKLGTGTQANWMFRQTDIEAMQDRKPGRPRTEPK